MFGPTSEQWKYMYACIFIVYLYPMGGGLLFHPEIQEQVARQAILQDSTSIYVICHMVEQVERSLNLN